MPQIQNKLSLKRYKTIRTLQKAIENPQCECSDSEKTEDYQLGDQKDKDKDKDNEATHNIN